MDEQRAQHPPAARDPSREVDHRSTTGAYRIFVKREYGRRQGDKPLWWVAAYHLVVKPLGIAFAILAYIFAAWVARRCGVTLPLSR